jgi:hypothetical protein
MTTTALRALIQTLKEDLLSALAETAEGQEVDDGNGINEVRISGWFDLEAVARYLVGMGWELQ